MTMKVQDAGTLRTITGMQVKQSGITRTIREVKVQDGGTLRTVAIFADPLTVSASDATGVSTTSTATADSVATPSGGFSPYTYAWANLTGTATIISGSATANPTFQETGLAIEETRLSTYRVTVTDDAGQTATDDITVSLSRISAS